MGKRVQKRFAHQVPLAQLHEKLVAHADAEGGNSGADDAIHFQRKGDNYTIRGNYSGFSIQGNILLTENDLTIQIELPMLAGLFKGKMEQYIDQQAKKLLG